MNKFNVFLAAVMVFAAVGQLSVAAGEPLVNELSDEAEIDDELEGGLFKSDARKPVETDAVDEFGWDVLDANKGVKDIVGKRTPDCKKATTKNACHTCCAGLDKAAEFKLMAKFLPSGPCTCFSRNNHYSTKLVA